MNNARYYSIILLLLMVCFPIDSFGKIKIRVIKINPAEIEFLEIVQEELQNLKTSENPNLKKLYWDGENALVNIFISPITSNRSTWHNSGNQNRSYTVVRAGKSYFRGQKDPAVSVIFLSFNHTGRPGFGGILVHELTHAMDLAYGLMHTEDQISERRAVFMENLWRDLHGLPLRRAYGDQEHCFLTLDYQVARKKHLINSVVSYIFKHNDLPANLAAQMVKEKNVPLKCSN